MAASSSSTNRWEAAWAAGIKPGDKFDAEGSSPALHLAIEKNWFKGKVMVPGCGRGYDVATLAAATGSAVGLEISSTAQSAATEYLKSQDLGDAKAVVHNKDFFTSSAEEVGGPFGSAFDYTFFCAIPVASRAACAQSYARMIRPGGALVCLQFPLHESKTEAELEASDGPPFPLSGALYDKALTSAGFVLETREFVPPDKSHPGRGGKEALALYRLPIPGDAGSK